MSMWVRESILYIRRQIASLLVEVVEVKAFRFLLPVKLNNRNSVKLRYMIRGAVDGDGIFDVELGNDHADHCVHYHLPN